MIDWLTNTEFLQNAVLLWLYALGGGLIAFALLHSCAKFVSAMLRTRQDRSPRTARATLLVVLESTRPWLVFVLMLLLAVKTLGFVAGVETNLIRAIVIVVGLQIAWWVNSLIKLSLSSVRRSGRARVNPVIATILSWTAQILVWVVLLMFVLANLGVNITALVASLGVGGVAVALALQNVLGDLFASAAIGLDEPFEVGQFIAFGKDLGTVEHVGIKTTRIKSLSGEQLIISNTKLLEQLIRNYGRMAERRVVFGFRVPYGTARERVEIIPARVRALLQSEQQVRFDRGHLANFGEFGLEFEFVYYVLSPDFTVYRDIQQRTNLGIMAMLEELGVEFAVPAREVRMTAAARDSQTQADAVRA